MKFGTREIVLFLAVLLLPIMSYFVIFKPHSEKIDQAKNEIAHKREKLEALRQETQRSADLIATNQDIQSRVDEMEDQLPSGKEVDMIVRQVSTLAIEAGLTPPTLKSSKPVGAALFREQPLEMSTKGSFDGFYAFLLSVEQLPRITRIVDMKLKESTTDGIELKAEFTLSIYFQPDTKVAEVSP